MISFIILQTRGSLVDVLTVIGFTHAAAAAARVRRIL